MRTRELQRLLRLVPESYADLEDALVPRSGGGGEKVSGGGGENVPPPARIEVAEHRHELLRGLRWWVERAGYRPGTVGESPPRMCAALHAVSARMRPEHVDELGDNLSTWLRRARSLASAERVRYLPLPAPCLSSSELWTCPGILSLALPEYGIPALTCRECGARFAVAELPQAAAVVVPVHVAASLLDVSVSTIKRRADRVDGMVCLGDAMTEPAQ